MNDKLHLAIDIGASGGRHILGWFDNGVIKTDEIHRFPNETVKNGDYLCWDIDKLFNEILTGLIKCRELGKIPSSVGIDTWGVDFVLLDKEDNLIGPAVAYRDDRTDGMNKKVDMVISEPELYKRAGIQKMFFNTIYQIMAVKQITPQHLDNAAHLLFLPDYLHYLLCGVKKNEYTISSTSGLLNAADKTWDDDIIARCGFPRGIFGEIVPAGTVLGGFTDDIRKKAGYDCLVITPPSHDTASAFLAVPAASERSVYISSGTWSLLGVELQDPVTSDASHAANFTNEGGYDHRYRYLKNIAGLWLIQSVHKEIGNGIGHPELIELARSSDCNSIFNVDDDRFAAPESMVETIHMVCKEYGQPEPQSLGDFARCIFRSLAESYSKTVNDLKRLTGIDYDSINIIGGGSQNGYLNSLTAAACGLPVYAGPTEGTALGNIVSQMITLEILPDLDTARKVIRNSFDIIEFN